MTQDDTKRLRVLFLCTGNSCRSQMAEGWAHYLKGDIIEAYSAGVERHGLNHLAVRAMAEAGVDIASHASKTLDDLDDLQFDYVVTVCSSAKERCPVFPGSAKVIHQGFDDPPKFAADARTEEEAMPPYRRVRDQIKSFVDGLPGLLEEGTQK